VNEEIEANPMQRAPRCGARTRRGTPCHAPAVRGRPRCRMHGGAAGSGAPRGSRNGAYKHGGFTGEAVAERQMVRQLLRHARELLGMM
jgi:glucans biosynthesis protein